MKKWTLPVLFISLGITAATGLSCSTQTPDQTPVSQEPAGSSQSGSPESSTSSDAGETSKKPSRHAVIYTVSPNGGGDDNNLVAQPAPYTSSQTPARDAIQALIDSHNSPLPTGTELRGLKIEDGLATVDFTQPFQSNFHGGETQESQTVNSILLTLGQFSSIDRVQILVEGKPIDALSQLSISGPLDALRPTSGSGAGAHL